METYTYPSQLAPRVGDNLSQDHPEDIKDLTGGVQGDVSTRMCLSAVECPICQRPIYTTEHLYLSVDAKSHGLDGVPVPNGGSRGAPVTSTHLGDYKPSLSVPPGWMRLCEARKENSGTMSSQTLEGTMLVGGIPPTSR